MDWLEKIGQKVKAGYKDMSLKQALIGYMTVGLLTAFLCSIVLFDFFENWKNVVAQVNGYDDVSYIYRAGGIVQQSVVDVSVEQQIFILKLLEILTFVLCIGTAVYVVAHQFYQKKLEEPLNILKTEMQYLSRDDLSFECSYLSGDEMGEICQTFNQMRLQLAKNQKKLWELMEAQRELNAAFAHDIRTPLTVLKGYTEMLTKHYPKGRISQERLLEILHLMEHQQMRIEQFSATMKEIHTMEEWQIDLKEKKLNEVYDSLKKNMEGMSTKQVSITIAPLKAEDETVILDEHLIWEVADNLVSNALRFARSKIWVTLQIEEENLYLYVKDDGKGFSKEALEKAKRPYYSSEPEHFGLGLTICQTLCKKHGGNLELLNSLDGGAIVCGVFYVR